MNYIVFDLEWNQCPGGKSKENPRLPFEIIEIGAVKLNERFEMTGEFSEVVRPLVYHHLHYRMKEVVPVDESEFKNARTFSRVIRDFISWCGPEDYRFVTWGSLDVNELQRNMDYYRIPNPFPFPLYFYDLQKLYSLRYDDGKKRLALEIAVDQMEIPHTRAFHRAYDDAYYTAQVMQKMDFSAVSRYESIDYQRLPRDHAEEILREFGTYTKLVSRPYANREAVMADKALTSLKCCKCRLPVWRRMRWFSAGGNVYLGLVQCPRHGYIKGKIRIKKLSDDRVFAVKTVKPVDETVVKQLKEKQELLREKRRTHRKNQRSKPEEN